VVTVCVYGAAGGVGAVASAAIIIHGIADRLLLVDIDENLLAVSQMDLSLLSGTYGGTEVVHAAPADAGSADIIVLTAGVPHRDGADRSAFAAENRKILDELLAVLPETWNGLLVIATNPVDVLATAAHRQRPDAAVLGYARNDSLRLAQAVGDVLDMPARQVQAWALGEHGSAMVPLFDRTRIAGRPVSLTDTQQADAVGRALDWYDRWQARGTGRTSMWTTGFGLAELVSAYLAEEPSVLPACAPVGGRYAVPHDVCLGQPVRLGGRRVHVLTWRLTAAQTIGMRQAAELVAELAKD
jgi:malate dehydrogenase